MAQPVTVTQFMHQKMSNFYRCLNGMEYARANPSLLDALKDVQDTQWTPYYIEWYNTQFGRNAATIGLEPAINTLLGSYGLKRQGFTDPQYKDIVRYFECFQDIYNMMQAGS